MGVRGLTSFIKENRQSLSTTITLDRDLAETHEIVNVVVDAWGSVLHLVRTTRN